MRASDFVRLLREANLQDADAAARLGVTVKTVLAWKEQGGDASIPGKHDLSLSELFQDLLEADVKRIAQGIFDAVPSELVSFWIVRTPPQWAPESGLPGASLVCLRTGQHIASIQTSEASKPVRAGRRPRAEPVAGEFAYELTDRPQRSLTLFPLYRGRPLCLVGDQIAEHWAKKFAGTRLNVKSAEGVSHSLLNVPIFRQFAGGRLVPVSIISLENKLTDDRKHVIHSQDVDEVYTMQDLVRLYDLIEAPMNGETQDGAVGRLLQNLMALGWQPEDRVGDQEGR